VQAQELFTKAEVLSFSPKANPELVAALVANQHLLRQANITTPQRLWHFFSQVATETAGIRVIAENMNYSERRLLEVFSRKRIAPEKAREIACRKANDPADCAKHVANWIYRNVLGNGGPETNDGWNYRGSGYIQLTGRGNFRRVGLEIGHKLEEQPELARRPVEGLKAAAAFWTARNINSVADRREARPVRVKVNGKAAHNLTQSIVWLRLAERSFRTLPSTATETVAVDLAPEAGACPASPQEIAEMLAEVGAVSQSFLESEANNPASVEQELNRFQEANELEKTGLCSMDVLYQLSAPEIAPTDDGVAVADPERSMATSFAAATETADSVLEPSEGSGIPVSLSAQAFSDEEKEALAFSDHAFPEYAMEFGHRGTGGLFAEFAVVGEDDRVVVKETTTYPASAIVQILFEDGLTGATKLCSGAMVAADTVLTAGHCIHTGGENGTWHRNFTIYPGRNEDQKPFGGCGATAGYALAGWLETEPTLLEASNYDLGAIKLGCRVGDRTGWLPVVATEGDLSGRPTKVQGYAAEKDPWGAQFLSHDSLRANDTEGLKAFYQNDTEGGTSGSPVFLDHTNAVFCVHTNGFLRQADSPWKENNGCTRITPTRYATILEWVTGR
jgi:putative chitinase